MAALNFAARFGEYAMLARVANLGVCEVWLVERTTPPNNARCFALYTLGSGSGASPVTAKALLDNGRRAMGFSHPNIARIQDILSIDGAAAVVEESVQGRRLASIIEQIQKCRNAIPLWFSLHVVRRVCEAVEYVKTQIDADGSSESLGLESICAAQIAISEQGCVRIHGLAAGALDVWCATHAAQNHSSAPRLRLHAAPSSGEPPNAGLLGVAGVLYDLLTSGAEQPSDDPHDSASAEPFAFVPPSHYAPWVPAAVDEIVRRALDRLCGDRFPDMRRFREALEAYLAERWGGVKDEDLAVFVNLLGRAEFEYRELSRSDDGCPVTRRADAFGRVAASAPPTLDSGNSTRGDTSARQTPSGSEPDRHASMRPKPGISRSSSATHDWAAAVANNSRLLDDGSDDNEGVTPTARAAFEHRTAHGSGEAAKTRTVEQNQIEPTRDVAAMFDAGLDCLRLGDLAGAEAAWREVLAVDPLHRAAAANLKRLQKRRE